MGAPALFCDRLRRRSNGYTSSATAVRRQVLLGVLLVGGALAVANWPGDPLPQRIVADALVVDKSDRSLTLFRDGHPLKTYTVSLGGAPEGHKAREGDERTPEGEYVIDRRNARSRYFRSLGVSYPAAADEERARAGGVSPGGDIMIHGLPNGFGWLGRLHRLWDWTDGCVAVTNGEMAELWRAVPVGAPITLRP